ncbi:hypothetical protein BX616_003139 [Lobosporangium transversale]|uniref:Uncharacterized protein n=1 Tax=Lobosporangium transversale TaxID=64571 RepID=A0A1Y2GUV2_9FUNG|nr:hypothetical protein BCR41DRAFT_349723 [Lobosporangium transversale]KAF9916683.1 hypothetical protein BX616_003139 [Lobosporangium transversale]ORZ22815.1 hypothetical protein BCR41DRAFT_349723 [Lobosporangium transversale]|eukprot:XP_021883369.1 hypothetical protein BCR41DRAFT_349723 [Lobosporangium transversale]
MCQKADQSDQLQARTLPNYTPNPISSPSTLTSPVAPSVNNVASTLSSSIPKRNSMSISIASSEPNTLSEKDKSLTPSINADNNTISNRNEKTKEQGTFLTRHSWLMGWNHEDWWPCWIGLFLFGMVAIAVHKGLEPAHFALWSSNPFDSLHGKENYELLVLFPLQGMLVWLALWAIKAKAFRDFWKGYLVVYSLSFLSKWLAAQKNIKSASLGDSIWAILFGAALRNMIAGSPQPDGRSKPLPPWLKVAQQTELYIATSLVLLCIDFNVLKPLAPRAFFVSWIDTPLLFVIVAVLGASWLKIDLQTSMIMSGATFICGSSAALALAASLGAGSKADLPIAIISVFTIPSIIALPYIAKAIGLSPQVSGAWFGGCVDSTGAVIAASTIYDNATAIETSAVVKMVQNVLIGPISVGVAAAWAKREERRKRELHSTFEDIAFRAKSELQPVPYRTLLWSRFPKFVLGFIMTAILFNTAVPSEEREAVNKFSFMVGEWYSTMSFVSIGLGLQFQELRREARLLLMLTALYALAQLVDILSTLGLAYVAFELF